MIAVVFALGFVLTLASSASAECAWVLWVGEQIHEIKRGEVTSASWTLGEAFDSSGRCRAAMKTQITEMVKTLRESQPGTTVLANESGVQILGGAGRLIEEEF